MKFSEWVILRESDMRWSRDRKSIENIARDSAECRKCGELYRVYNYDDFFAGRSRCPKCGGQGDMVNGRKLSGVGRDRYPQDERLSRLPGQEG